MHNTHDLKSQPSLNKTESLTKIWPLYLSLFISYILCAYLLSSSALQNQLVPIGLPAGIALVGCYLWWWRFFPAVFFAAFIVNFVINPHSNTTFLWSNVVIENVIIASGASLQAIVGGALLRYWLGNPIHQWKKSKILYFVFIVGILVNLISATIGVNTRSELNPQYAAEDFQLNLIFWWLGDSLGVLLTLPFILSLVNFRQLTTEQRKDRWIIIYSVSALFIIVTLLSKFFITNANSNKNELLTKEVRVIENGIYRQISSSIEHLSLLANFIQQTPNASRLQFKSFVDKLTQNSNTLKAISWNPIIKQNQKLIHEKKLTQLYQKQLSIRGNPLAINDDIVYVKLISPEVSNSKAIGFNVYSNPSRKKTLNKTMINYQPQATPIIQLVQSTNNAPAFLLFFPVFEPPKKTANTINKQLIGFATGVFLAEKIIANAISSSQENLFYYQVFEENKKQWFIANTHSKQRLSKEKNKYFSHSFNVAGQTWHIKLFANKSYLKLQQQQEFFRLIILLLIISTTIITSILLMNNRQLQLKNLVNQKTKSLSAAMKEANYANKAKSQFLANMSHEIRTPMNSVIGFAQLAKTSDNMAEIKSYLENIDISSELLLHIVNNILDISKIESEKLFISHDTFDMHAVLERIHRLFSAEANKKKLTWCLTDNIPAAINFSGDQTRIEQILINLCGNAIKFTQYGSVSITADLQETIDNKAHIIIIITDTGIGIAQEHITKLFNPFTQADASTSRDFGGTGLGLAIAKKLSQLMSGDITIKSELAVGSHFTFTCWLPIASDKPIKNNNNNSFQQLSEQHGLDSRQPTKNSTNKPQGLAALKVLVAEDNRINQKLISIILTKLSINAVIVENGQLAVDYVKKEAVDVILMDCQMPVLDGYQATEQIRAMPEYSDLPIFALTADVDTRSKEKALSLGFTKHLAKPINIKELTECLFEVKKLSS